MSESTEKPTDDPHGRQREDDPQKQEASARPRWHVRLKQKLKARAVVILHAGIASLERLKSRAGGQEEAREERGGSRLAAEPKKAVEAALPRSRLRRILIYVMLMLIAAIIGMTFAYRLLSKVLSDQSEKIRTQMEEISAYSLENQDKASHIAELMKEIDNQRVKLIEAEKRLSETAVKVPEPESRAKEAELKNPEKLGTPRSEAARTGQPSRASTFNPSIPTKTGNCDLAVGGNNADALKRCIDNFNRK